MSNNIENIPHYAEIKADVVRSIRHLSMLWHVSQNDVISVMQAVIVERMNENAL